MGRNGDKDEDTKSNRPPVKTDAKPKPKPKPSADNDDIEDGDMATPKRDRDDEQQGL